MRRIEVSAAIATVCKYTRTHSHMPVCTGALFSLVKLQQPAHNRDSERVDARKQKESVAIGKIPKIKSGNQKKRSVRMTARIAFTLTTR